MSALRVVRGIVGGAASDARGALPLWLASIPDTFTPAQGRDAAQAALDDADAVIGNVKLRFEGTLPPPPWPKGPQLTKAIGDVEIARDAMAALADKAESGAIDSQVAEGERHRRADPRARGYDALHAPRHPGNGGQDL